jgi:hypothetical protein
MLEKWEMKELTGLLERLLFIKVAQRTMLMCCMPSVRRVDWKTNLEIRVKHYGKIEG